MNTEKKNKKTVSRERGFSLMEVMIALAITLVVLWAAFAMFKSMSDTGGAAAQLTESNTDVQASLNMIRRDLRKVDGGDAIPSAGIPLQAGDWADTRWIDTNVLLLGGTDITARAGIVSNTNFALDAITPGTVNNNSAMSLVYIDEYARGIGATLLVTPGNNTVSVTAAGANSSRVSAIEESDFILIKNIANNNVIMAYVTGVNSTGGTTTISLATGTDPSGVNQGLDTNFIAPGNAVQVNLLRYVAYFLDVDPNQSDSGTAWLMRQVNLKPATQLIPGVTGFKLTYDVVDNSTGTPTIKEVDISGGTGSRTDKTTAYSGQVTLLDADYFTVDPARVMDILRVNINVENKSGKINPGSNRRVALDQTARVTVRQYSGLLPPPCDPAPLAPPAPPMPTLREQGLEPQPPKRPTGDGYNCRYIDNSCQIHCDLHCPSSNGSGCNALFAKYASDKNVENFEYREPASSAYTGDMSKPNWYQNGYLRLETGKGIDEVKKHIIMVGNNPNINDPANVFWLKYDGPSAPPGGFMPVPLVYRTGGCSVNGSPYYCSDPNASTQCYDGDPDGPPSWKDQYQAALDKYQDDHYDWVADTALWEQERDNFETNFAQWQIDNDKWQNVDIPQWQFERQDWWDGLSSDCQDELEDLGPPTWGAPSSKAM